MKKILIVLVVLLMASALAFAGGEQEGAGEAEGEQVQKEEPLRVVLYVNGTLGDKSFFDSAHNGLEMAEEDYNVFAKTVEGSYDSSRWEPDLTQLAEGDWDIIIAGTWQLQEYLEKLAPMHPEKRFFTYDTSVDYSKEGLDNVYSILYSQNEGSFLVGALSAMITNSDMDKANSEKVVGFLGGMDIPVINDFKVGYVEGVEYVDPDVDVLVSYAGAFNDPAKGKELTLAMFDQGADITFNVGGETGLGGIDAAKEREQYTLGVDSDQYKIFKETDPEKAEWIVTSMMKNVDLSIYRGIRKHIEGTLAYGEAEVLGLAENGVGVADNENYKRLVPKEYRDRVQEIADMIEAGEISVGTAIGK
ncbi:MAG: BMP family ABC transporter substrate-binding protein [Spirochaetales bacterium]|nr:BMP family ABC transporter substrate-binding protein [Spirochaetales bacterium]MCF7937685.1 BMP family ABC transporter substrate-binding protein [Spirochaetales bacterium]